MTPEERFEVQKKSWEAHSERTNNRLLKIQQSPFELLECNFVDWTSFSDQEKYYLSLTNNAFSAYYRE